MRVSASLPLAAIALTLASFAPKSKAQTVAQTPPMGWNSWNYFAERVDDKGVRAAADEIVSTGMKDAGYIYVNIDDTWEGERDANGLLHTNSKFPDMKALADYVHSKGLKIGIYSGPGTKTCGHYAASLGHEEQDAKMYADWGIDYLKYDLCSFFPDVMQKQAPDDRAAQMRLMHEAYVKMGNALKATGRPIVFSLCQYGWDSVWEWAPVLGGNLWRTTGDISPRWDRMYAILEQQEGLEKYAGPGHWNDPDMLEVGNGKLSLDENRAHFSMWAVLAAPLLAGNDLTSMKPEIKAILTDRDRPGCAWQTGIAYLQRWRSRGMDPAVIGRCAGGGGAERRQRSLFDASLPPEPGTTRPAWRPARQRPVDREARRVDRQHALGDCQPRRVPGADWGAEVRRSGIGNRH
jgi:alpha-galactosidase